MWRWRWPIIQILGGPSTRTTAHTVVRRVHTSIRAPSINAVGERSEPSRPKALGRNHNAASVSPTAFPASPLPSNFTVLRNLLCTSHINTKRSSSYSPQNIRALYLSCPNASHDLSPSRLSNLIALFGTLSLPRHANNLHTVLLGKYLDNKAPRSWWGFVLHVIRDKKRAGKALTESDLYWLVTARLGEAGIKDVVVDPGNNGTLATARQIYTRIKLVKGRDETHIPYLRTLQSLRRSRATIELSGWLCFLLGRRSPVPSSVQDFLWTVVLDKNLPLLKVSTRLKLTRRLLDTLSQRILSEAPSPADSGLPTASDSEVVDNKAIDADPSFPVNSTDLFRQLSLGLFGRTSNPRTPSQLAVRSWATYQVQAMFAPALDVNARWRNLRLLALTNAQILTFPTIDFSPIRGPGNLDVVDVKVVAVLSIIERIANAHRLSPELYTFVKALWRMWQDAIQEDRTVHPALIRPILISFLRLASHARDDQLRQGCLHIANTGFWTFDLGDDYARRQVQLLVAEYVAASAACGMTVWEEILDALPHYVAFPQWHSMLIGQALMRLARVDAQRAWEMYDLWHGHLELPKEVVPRLCLELLRGNQVDLAIPLLAQCTFEGVTGRNFLADALFSLARRKKRFVDVELLMILGKALLEMSSSPLPLPLSYRARISWALVTMVSSGDVITAMAVLRNIQVTQPSYLPPQSMFTLLRALLHHRAFKQAARLVREQELAYPNNVASWRRTLLLHLVTKRATNLSARVAKTFHDKSLVHTLVRRSRYGKHATHPTSLSAFRVLQSLRQRGGPGKNGFHYGLRLISKTRSHAAIEEVFRTTVESSTRNCTAAGNVILHRYTTARGGRTKPLRSLIRAVDTLRRERNFVPDHVTTNIILKAILGLPSRLLDSVQTRRLFDTLVSKGYPAGARFSMDNPPFGTKGGVEGIAISGYDLPPMAGTMSFARHLRPFYKMFAKAFFWRGDVLAARTVVGILKEVEGEMAAEQRQGWVRQAILRRAGRGPK
ncbi:hypothetical protein OF83DRAFT_837425 [Amylostereum chailletii]|nr:hypothetical protein OF83DRAFT_837425 [Amylostereum chailletii]